MTLHQGQGHVNLYQNVDFNTIYVNITFEANRFINVRMHDNFRGGGGLWAGEGKGGGGQSVEQDVYLFV